jgi:hypothetical protein
LDDIRFPPGLFLDLLPLGLANLLCLFGLELLDLQALYVGNLHDDLFVLGVSGVLFSPQGHLPSLEPGIADLLYLYRLSAASL